MRSIVSSRAVAIMLLAASLLVGPVAHATIEGLIVTTVIVQEPQTEGYCYVQTPISAEVGIGIEAQTEGTLSPLIAYRNRPYAGPFAELMTIAGRSYVNLNAISLGQPMAHTYISDGYAGNVFEYRLVVDASALAAHNGTTAEGRQRTITQAKLALLAIARNTAGMEPLWRLYLTFTGLPSQSGLSGVYLPATTKWPYTAGSPLLAQIEDELISAWCPSGTIFGGKADDVTVGPAAIESAEAGCTISGRPTATGAALALLLVAGLLLAFRRARS